MKNTDDYNQNTLNDIKLLLNKLDNIQKDNQITLRDILDYNEQKNINKKYEIKLRIANTNCNMLITNNGVQIHTQNNSFLLNNNIEGYDYILNNIFIDIDNLPEIIKEDLEGIRLNQLILNRLREKRNRSKIKSFVKKMGLAKR